jgi:hypothetical protein
MTYITKRYLDDLSSHLSDRDITIIGAVSELRWASGRQLQRLFFTEGSALTQARRCRRTLERLTRQRLLARLERRIGGVRHGSAGFVYALDVAGQRFAGKASRPRRPYTPAGDLLPHTLAVAELYVQLREREHLGDMTLLRFVAECGVWGRLRADAYAQVGIAVEDKRFKGNWFIEVDRDTESLTRISAKLSAYRNGRQQAHAGSFPRVAFLTFTDKRRLQLAELIQTQPSDTRGLFVAVDFDQAVDFLTAGPSPANGLVTPSFKELGGPP